MEKKVLIFDSKTHMELGVLHGLRKPPYFLCAGLDLEAEPGWSWLAAMGNKWGSDQQKLGG